MKNMLTLPLLFAASGFFVFAFQPADASAQESVRVQSTTSTRDSGLYDFIFPRFKEASGITVNVVAVGTGQAIQNARDCNGDVLLVHSKPDEEKFVADGYGVKRYDLMYNDFVLSAPRLTLRALPARKTSNQRWPELRRPKAILPHAVTILEPTRRNCACGKLPVSTRRNSVAHGIWKPDREWATRSMWQSARIPIR